MKEKLTPPKRVKESHQIQFYPDVKKIGNQRAKELGISFQAYLEKLILEDK